MKVLALEKKIILEKYGKYLWLLRNMPEHAVHHAAGIVIPPHELYWLRNFFAGYKENLTVASRGTSKSFTTASLAAPMYALLHKNRNILIVSASGFRGGKLLFKDIERMFLGELKSQELPGPFLRASAGKQILSKDPAMWSMPLRSNSNVMTIPTNNADNMRGIRANIGIVDERNTFDGEVVQKIIRPMLNVGQDFRRTATGSDTNQMFSVSTIDYTVRDWFPEIEASKKLVRREYEAQKALKAGDHAEYRKLMLENEGELKTSSLSYSRFDYTDLIIPQKFVAFDGIEYYTRYPLMPGTKLDDVCKYDERDQEYLIFTYPVDKDGLEKPLRDGTMDEDLWLAEQRNVFISSAGNVYPHDLIIKVAEKPIYQAGKLPGRPEIDEDYYAPVMYSCGDPCVLGVDVARETDESAIVVIRLGELAKGKFDPTQMTVDAQGRPCLGETTWNHVCWAESWKKMTQAELAERIRAMFQRYNIVHTSMAGGIGMDKRGGGGDVRDNLALPRPPVDASGRVDPNWDFTQVLKVYDPGDEDYAHYDAYDQPDYWSGLRILNTTAMDNQEWTSSSKGMMQQGKLYLARWQPPSSWAAEKGLVNSGGSADYSNEEFLRWLTGYDGVRRLRQQLQALQRSVTEQGTVRFVMPTKDRNKEEGKKDLWASMIYCTAMARQHLVDGTREEDLPPDVGPVMVEIGSGYKGRGDNNWYQRLYNED